MTFLMLFNFGYALFLLACILVYFFIPHTYAWIVLVVLHFSNDRIMETEKKKST